MKVFLAAALMGVLLGMAPSLPSPISQDFAGRISSLNSRVTSAQGRGLLAPGQEPLLRAQLGVAQRAGDAHDPNASSMLDAVDRQMAQADHALSRAEDGQAIAVRLGDDVTIAMHDPYTYDLHLSDPAVITMHPGIMWIRGIQGIYTARKPGMVTVTLVPRSGVTPAPPASMQNPVRFAVVVLAAPQR